MEDLQGLLEKINREGVEQADAEAKRIVDEAKAKAEAIVREAGEKAAKAKAEAEADAKASVARANETISQAARDVVLGVKDAITSLLVRLLTEGVDRALADEATSVGLVTTAIGELTGPGEITCGPQLAKALNAQLAKLGSFSVTTDATVGSGFTVKLDGGRVEHSFTSEVIAGELAKRLRPDLAKLIG